MIFRCLKVVAVAAVMTLGTNAFAVQDCGCAAQSVSYGSGSASSCGRNTSYGYAASLWADYCQDDCSYQGCCSGSCRLGGLFKNRKSLGNFGCNSGCDSGCDSGCGCDDGCGGGRCGGRRKGRRRGGNDCCVAAPVPAPLPPPSACGCGDDCGGGCGGGLFSGRRAKRSCKLGSRRSRGSCCDNPCDPCGDNGLMSGVFNGRVADGGCGRGCFDWLNGGCADSCGSCGGGCLSRIGNRRGDRCGCDDGCGGRTGLLSRIRARKGGCESDCGCDSSCGCGSGGGLFARIGSRRGGGSDCCGDCGCDSRCNIGGKVKGLFSRNRGDGCGCDTGCGCERGCNMRSRVKGMFAGLRSRCGSNSCCDCGCDCGSGGGIFSRRRGRKCCNGGTRGRLFNRNGASTCGTTDGYFNQYVGSEYGTTDFQSAVRGQITNECGPMVFMPSQNACGGCPSNNVSFQTQVQNDDNSQTGVMVDSVQDVQDPTEAFSTTSSTDIVGEAVQQGFDSFSSDAD